MTSRGRPLVERSRLRSGWSLHRCGWFAVLSGVLAIAAAASFAAATGGPVVRPGVQARGHVDVTVSLTPWGTADLLWRAERPGEAAPPPSAPDPLVAFVAQLRAAGWDAAMIPVTPGRDVAAFEVRCRPAAAAVRAEGTIAPAAVLSTALPVDLAAGGSSLAWTTQSYLVVTLHRVQLKLRPGERLLTILAPPASQAAVPTLALFLRVPGRVLRSNAEARSGDMLYWAWTPVPEPFVAAAATALELHPIPAGLAVLGAVIGVGGGALAYDAALRGRRSRHRRRGRGRRAAVYAAPLPDPADGTLPR